MQTVSKNLTNPKVANSGMTSLEKQMVQDLLGQA